MSWAKFSDDTQRNEHILGLSVPARWLWVSAIMDNRSYEGGRSPFISMVRANALVRQQGVSRKLIPELVEAGRWEPTDGGWNIRHFERYLPSRREEAADHEPDPVKAAAGSKGAAARQQAGSKAVTEAVADWQQTGSPVARGPVPVPVPVQETKSTLETKASSPDVPKKRAKGNAEPELSPEAIRLAKVAEELIGHQLSGIDYLGCEAIVTEFPYLDAEAIERRMRSHCAWCDENHQRRPQTVRGFHSTLRLENVHVADQGGRKTTSATGRAS